MSVLLSLLTHPVWHFTILIYTMHLRLAMENCLRGTCSFTFAFTAESVPIGYSDFIGCLKPGFQNDIEVTVGDKKVIIPFDSARLGEYYIMTLQMDGEEINSTSELYVPRYTCQFSIKSPYGLGLTAIR